MKPFLLLAFGAIVLAVIACGCTTQPTGTQPAGTQPTGTQPAVPAPVSSTPVPTGQNIPVYTTQVPATPTMAPPTSPAGSWDLTGGTLVTIGGGPTGVRPTQMISAIFGTDGTVQGFGGCSDYSGVYTTTGSSVRVTNIISTPTSCGNVLETQERAYLAILGASSTFENTGSTLTILTSSSPPGKLVFQPGNATPSPVITAIVGTWGLTQMTKNYASLSIVAASQPTATFTADGNLSGTGGCNQYSGRYMLSGISSISSSSISIGPLATTKMYCADPVMSQEVAYFGILGNAARWEFLDTSGTLTIWDNSTSLNRLDFKKFVQ